MTAINPILDMNPEKILSVCKENKMTVCGFGVISTMLFATKELGATQAKLIDYSTSFEISKDKRAIVGYAGLLIE